MAVRTRIDSISRDIDLIVSDLLSPEAQSRAVANYARSEIAEADGINKRVLGRVPPKAITVDGSVGAPLDRVKPQGGHIVAEWELIADVLVWIGNALRDNSPVVSGDYRNAHTLFADGVEVPLEAGVPFAEEYVFLNPLPYSRRLEMGKTKSGRPFVVQVPPRIYERTAKSAQSRFGNIVKLKYTFRAPEGAKMLKYVSLGRVWLRNKKGRFVQAESTGDRAAAAHERSLRVPAIVVTVRER